MTKSRGPKPHPAGRRAASTAAPWLTLNGAPELSPAAARLCAWLAWALACALGIALLLVIAGPHQVGDAFTETDFYGGYVEGARLIQHGHLDPGRYGVIGPGYEIALALFGLPFRNLFLAAELLSAVSLVSAVLLWFALLRRRVDARLALIAVAFMAVNSTFFRYGFSATTDALALALQALALYLLLARSGPRTAALAGLHFPALAGLAAAAAFLTRYNAIYLLPAAWLAIGLGGTAYARRGRAALAFTLGFLAPVLPWIGFSLAHGGTLQFQLHHNIAYDVFARSRGIPWDQYQEKLQSQFPTLWSVIQRDPGAVTRREFFNVFDHVRNDAGQLMGWPVAICAVLGLALAWRDGTLRKLWPLLAAGVLLFLTLVPAFYSERYSLSLVPMWAMLASALFASPLLALAIGRARRVWLKPALALLPLGLAVRVSVAEQRHLFTQLPVDVLENAKTLRELKRPGDRIIARKPHIAFHGELPVVPFPFTKNLPDLGRYAREKHARWLYFSWLEAELRPEYVYLLDTTGVVPGLTARHATVGHPAVLYEIGPELGLEPAWMRNDTLVAVHELHAELMIQPRDTEALYRLATIERLRGNFVVARNLLGRAVTLRPNDARLWLLLGDVQLRLADPAGADEAFVRSLVLDPNNPEPQIGRGWASLALNRPEDAATMWRPVVAQTHDPNTLRQMIRLFAHLGDAQNRALAEATLARLQGTP